MADAGANGLRIFLLNYWYEPGMTSLAEIQETYYTQARWAQSLHVEGADVTVFQRFGRQERSVQHGVHYVLVKDHWSPRLRRWQIPLSLHHAVRNECRQSGTAGLTVVHCNGLHFSVQLRALRAVLPERVPIAVQDHAERPSSGLRRSLQRHCLRGADGFFFSARELASPWVISKLINDRQQVYELMEGSTDFRRRDRATARAETGLVGDPVVLWVGRLVSLKDPLTVLDGFEQVLRQAPKASLHMVYTDDALLTQVRNRVASSTLLCRSVRLWGSVPHAALESFFNSADYFVLGSHHEGSGYSLVEALACGVVPVVTDIPSFRVLTNGGTIGACWTPGDSSALAAAFLRVLCQPVRTLSDRAVHFFEQRLNFQAIARQAVHAYRELAERRAIERQG